MHVDSKLSFTVLVFVFCVLKLARGSFSLDRMKQFTLECVQIRFLRKLPLKRYDLFSSEGTGQMKNIQSRVVWGYHFGN